MHPFSRHPADQHQDDQQQHQQAASHQSYQAHQSTHSAYGTGSSALSVGTGAASTATSMTSPIPSYGWAPKAEDGAGSSSAISTPTMPSSNNNSMRFFSSSLWPPQSTAGSSSTSSSNAGITAIGGGAVSSTPLRPLQHQQQDQHDTTPSASAATSLSFHNGSPGQTQFDPSPSMSTNTPLPISSASSSRPNSARPSNAGSATYGAQSSTAMPSLHSTALLGQQQQQQHSPSSYGIARALPSTSQHQPHAQPAYRHGSTLFPDSRTAMGPPSNQPSYYADSSTSSLASLNGTMQPPPQQHMQDMSLRAAHQDGVAKNQLSPWSSASSTSNNSGQYHSLPFVGHSSSHDLTNGMMQPVHMSGNGTSRASGAPLYESSTSYRSMPLMWDGAGQSDVNGNSTILGLNGASGQQHSTWLSGHDSLNSMQPGSITAFPPSMMTSLPPSSTNGGVAAQGWQYQDDEAKWQAVMNRSLHADRHFLYASTSAQTYCRPSCHASASATKHRQPPQYLNQGHPRGSRSDCIRFFSQPDAAIKAEAMGFKSCKRCRPEMAYGPGSAVSGSPMDGLGLTGMARSAGVAAGGGEHQHQHRTVIAVRECVREMMLVATNCITEGDGEPRKRTLKDYAAKAGLSTFHFHRSLTKLMSLTPGDFSKATQSLHLQDMLGMDNAAPGAARVDDHTFNEALRGWSVRRAKRALGGLDPGMYARGELGNRTKVVRTTITNTPFGEVGVVYTAAPNPTGIQHQDMKQRYQLGASLAASAASAAWSTSLAPPRPDSPHSTGSPMMSTSSADRVIYALVLSGHGTNVDGRLARRFPTSMPGDTASAAELRDLVTEVMRSGVREGDLADETKQAVRRARIWVAVKRTLNGSGGRGGSGGANGNGAAGSDERDGDEMDGFD